MFMGSYDITSLFTNIPFNESMKIAVEIIMKSKPNIKISKNNLATSRSHFLFDGNYYDQIWCVAMSSPLASVCQYTFSIH